LGGTLRGAFWRATDSFVALVVLVQLLAQVSQAVPPEALPPHLQTLYAVFAGFQLVGIAVPSACIAGSPSFLYEKVVFSVASAAAVALLWCLYFIGRPDVPDRCRCQEQRRTRELQGQVAPPQRSSVIITDKQAQVVRAASASTTTRQRRTAARIRLIPTQLAYVLVAGVTLMFPLVLNAGLNLLQCQATVLSTSAAVSVDGYGYSSSDPAAPQGPGAAGTTTTVPLLVTNPSYKCYSGSHLPAGVLAWLAVVLVVVIVPVASLLWICSASRSGSVPQVVPVLRMCRRIPLSSQSPLSHLHAQTSSPADGTKPSPNLADAVFGGLYLPQFLWLYVLDLACQVAFGCFLVLWRFPATAGAHAAKTALTCAVCGGVGAVLITLRPHLPPANSRLLLRLAALVLTALVSVFNAVAAISGSGFTTTAASYVVLTSASVFVALVVATFATNAVVGARLESARLRATLKAGLSNAAQAVTRSAAQATAMLKALSFRRKIIAPAKGSSPPRRLSRRWHDAQRATGGLVLASSVKTPAVRASRIAAGAHDALAARAIVRGSLLRVAEIRREPTTAASSSAVSRASFMSRWAPVVALSPKDLRRARAKQ